MKNENTQHTPAPWRYDNKDDGENIEIHSKDFRVWIADVKKVQKDNKQAEANAQLIARAPELLKENEQLKEQIHNGKVGYAKLHALNAELLEVLKEVIGDISAPYGFDARRIPNESVKKALSAIAKAEGKNLVVS